MVDSLAPVETSPLAPPLPSPAPRRRLHIVLFAATLVTLTMAGAWFWSDSGLEVWGWKALSPQVLAHGLPYALLVVLILGAHEMGHYFACRYYGVSATLPYFIPGIPMPIGTFGAVIRIRSPFPSRRALFDIAAAGPIAGFAMALPILAIGVALAHTAPDVSEPHGLFLGPPLISWLLERGLHGDANLQVGSIYGAAWVGMLVTSLNLLPVGQLDGGHAVFAVSPTLHRAVSWIAIATFAVFVAGQAVLHRTVSGYSLWLVILLFLRGRHPRLIDEITPLDRPRRLVGAALALMLVLTFIPVPLQVL
jgi:membrane-associated protease RseP (regulator of RpoE activity)